MTLEVLQKGNKVYSTKIEKADTSHFYIMQVSIGIFEDK